jgi:hypothetical protein
MQDNAFHCGFAETHCPFAIYLRHLYAVCADS